MFFSIQTIAIIAPLLIATSSVASPLEDRSSYLCNQQNYGASGKPWQSSSTPGSFCGSSKPSNSKAWKNIPYWDGGDSVRCSTSSGRKNYNVCKGGNSKASLPHKCNPPHRHSKGTTTSTSMAKATTSAIVSTYIIPSVISSVVSSAVSVASSAVSSAAAVTSAPAITAPVTSTGSAAASTSAATVDPLSDPVCELTYQVTYQNYTIVAPSGVWYGMTVGAAAQDASYMTYTLANTVDDCLAACDQIEGCVFVNTYYDENDTETDLPKHTPGVLTCAMFSSCVSTDNNNNFGGQDDPNIIVNSNGYCKSGACSS